MFHVDPTDPTPVEVQLVRTIRSAVGAGLLAPGDRLPTVRQLAVELMVVPSSIVDSMGASGVLSAAALARQSAAEAEERRAQDLRVVEE